MSNYKLANIGKLEDVSRVMFQDKIDSTGCEVSINNIPAGMGSPFIHSHKLNEEVIIITKGNGLFYIDGDEMEIEEGSIIRIDTEGKRGFYAKDDLQFICIQSNKNSLKQVTREDGIIHKDKTSWIN